MPKVLAPIAPVNQLHRQTLLRRLVRQSCLAAALIAILAVTTGAAVDPNASRAELILYSLGSVVTIVAVVRIVIKLFWYILQSIVIMAILLTVYVLALHAIRAVHALIS